MVANYLLDRITGNPAVSMVPDKLRPFLCSQCPRDILVLNKSDLWWSMKETEENVWGDVEVLLSFSLYFQCNECGTGHVIGLAVMLVHGSPVCMHLK